MARSGGFDNPQPYSRTQNITKSDSTVYNPPLDAFISGTAANVAITDVHGNVVTIPCAAGVVMPIAATKIMSTNTTGTPIIGLNW